MLVSSKGIGSILYSTADNVPGENNACGLSFASFLFNPMCWGDSFANWQAAYDGQSTAQTLIGSAPDQCTATFGFGCPTIAIAGAVVLLLLLKR